MIAPRPQPLTIDLVKAGPLPMDGFAIVGGRCLAYLIRGVAENGKLDAIWHNGTEWVPVDMPPERLFADPDAAWLNESIERESEVERLTEDIGMLELQLETAKSRLANACSEFRRLTGREVDEAPREDQLP